MLTSVISDPIEKGVGSIGDETEAVDIGTEPVVDVSRTNNNDGHPFMLALVSCHCQPHHQRSNIILNLVLLFHSSKMTSTCGGWHMGLLKKQERKRL